MRFLVSEVPLYGAVFPLPIRGRPWGRSEQPQKGISPMGLGYIPTYREGESRREREREGKGRGGREREKARKWEKEKRKERILIELMTSDRKRKASREGAK